jgi:hypothetical protein
MREIRHFVMIQHSSLHLETCLSYNKLIRKKSCLDQQFQGLTCPNRLDWQRLNGWDVSVLEHGECEYIKESDKIPTFFADFVLGPNKLVRTFIEHNRLSAVLELVIEQVRNRLVCHDVLGEVGFGQSVAVLLADQIKRLLDRELKLIWVN